MIRRPALAAVSVLLLLGTTIPAALAHPSWARHGRTSAALPPSSLAVVTSYFAALHHHGRPGHDEQALNRLYAPAVTLTESLSSSQPRTSTGRQQVRAFDQWNQLDWVVYRSQQLSPAVILTIEGLKPRPGHEGQGDRYLSLFTVKHGQIVTLVWMPC